MKNIFSKLLLTVLLGSLIPGTAVARECMNCQTSNHRATVQSKAAVCKRAQSTAELNVNNVRALINGYGNMWYDGSVAQYHLPKNSNTSPLYCAALWIGGTDVNDQLRIAALCFGQYGDDYWPGPLELTSAYVDLEMCNKYDKHFIISQSEVQTLRGMFDYTGSTPVAKDFDESKISQVIKDWPAHDEDNQYVSTYIAPFFDADGDGVYNYRNGDYPYYDFDNELCPRTWKANHPGETLFSKPTYETTMGVVKGGIMSDQVLKGDQTIWWVFNDMGNVHTETKGQPIGLEIRAQAFAFSTNDKINDMTFYSYEIINRSTYTLKDTYFSQWVDPDLGYAYDDYVGCDVRRGLGYCYNGDEADGPGSGSYSGIPPAVGIDFFQGPYMDPDGKDNPKIDIEKMKAFYATSLSNYKQLDSNGEYVGDRDGKVVYDTFALTQDADLFIKAWYFKAGDTLGNCAINGVNFGNGIVDDERFGMRRFVYYINDATKLNGEPQKATDYYNYLKGKWKDGRRMYFGGDGLNTGVIDGLGCDFMFPGDSDPWNWGTNGVNPKEQGYTLDSWTEANEGNKPHDCRILQSAGPFTLKPGAVNYITVGIPFAQAASGNAWSSVELLREIDDVCQALFENCFKVLDGPDAPTLIVQELNNEVVLYLTYDNPKSNNYGENYSEIDPSIVKSFNYTEIVSNAAGDTTYTHGDTIFTTTTEVTRTHVYDSADRSYKFEGYQIFQLVDANASIADIGDITKARPVAQCDIENYYDDEKTLPIATLVNYETNTSTGILTGTTKVTGSNRGVQHVFRIKNDAFATGTNTTLVNNKEYYFIAVAYAHNRYKEYSQTEAANLDGQKTPYLAGRKNEWGATISPVTAIPHNPTVENGGTIIRSEFGMSPSITRIEGHGNGGNVLKLTQASIDKLMGAPGVPGMAPGVFSADTGMINPCVIDHPQYEENYGPLNVRVIDPLNVKAGQFVINFDGADSTSHWTITNADPTKPVYDTVYKVKSDFIIGRYNEQLFLDLGIAVSIENPSPLASSLQIDLRGSTNYYYFYGGFINASSYLNSSFDHSDINKQWLTGIPDNDNMMAFNWVRSGMQYQTEAVTTFRADTTAMTGSEPYLDYDFYKQFYSALGGNARQINSGIDKTNLFENVAGGLWAPYGLVSNLDYHPGFNLKPYIADDRTLDSLQRKYDPNKSKGTYSRHRLERYMMDNTHNYSLMFHDFAQLPSVRIVFTADTSKWTRCPVLEMCDDATQSENNARKFHKRIHLSVDKMGRTIEDLGIAANENDPSNPAYIDAEGMGWFPGYAIDLSTGARLNIMFGEDSRYVQYNGNDMLWNPVMTYMNGSSNYVMGGRHFIYVMNSIEQPYMDLRSTDENNPPLTTYRTPSYDAGRWANKMLGSLDRLMKAPAGTVGSPKVLNGVVADQMAVKLCAVRDSISMLFASVAYVNMPLVTDEFSFKYPGHNATLNAGYPSDGIPCDVAVEIHVNVPYGNHMDNINTSALACGQSVVNNDNPRYMFEIGADMATLYGQATRNDADKSYQETILNAIGVVPNPYYNYSSYETLSQLETKVRFVNIPTGSTISIYTVDGTLVRRLGPTSGTATTVDWDLHNHTGLPIAGGMYLVHVNVPNIGERVIKWFGTMRPVDLNSFQF